MKTLVVNVTSHTDNPGERADPIVVKIIQLVGLVFTAGFDHNNLLFQGLVLSELSQLQL